MTRYAKGHPGGPGRPKGSRNKLTEELDAIALRHAPEALLKVAELAKEGTAPWASKLLVQQPWHRGADSAPMIELPAITGAESLTTAQSSLIAAATSGELPMQQAAMCMSMIEMYRRAVHTLDQERRLEELEKAIAKRSDDDDDDDEEEEEEEEKDLDP